MKTCTKCRESKPLAAFNSHANTHDKKRPDCADCHARYHRVARTQKDRDYFRNFELYNKYGITIEDYNRMFAKQEGRCAICDRHVTESLAGKWKNLGVDHDHDTGAVRGLLCMKCNSGLASFGDNPARIESALKYLRKHGRKEK